MGEAITVATVAAWLDKHHPGWREKRKAQCGGFLTIDDDHERKHYTDCVPYTYAQNDFGCRHLRTGFKHRPMDPNIAEIERLKVLYDEHQF